MPFTVQLAKLTEALSYEPARRFEISNEGDLWIYDDADAVLAVHARGTWLWARPTNSRLALAPHPALQ